MPVYRPHRAIPDSPTRLATRARRRAPRHAYPAGPTDASRCPSTGRADRPGTRARSGGPVPVDGHLAALVDTPGPAAPCPAGVTCRGTTGLETGRPSLPGEHCRQRPASYGLDSHISLPIPSSPEMPYNGSRGHDTTPAQVILTGRTLIGGKSC